MSSKYPNSDSQGVSVITGFDTMIYYRIVMRKLEFITKDELNYYEMITFYIHRTDMV
jgi:hypothetical protein